MTGSSKPERVSGLQADLQADLLADLAAPVATEQPAATPEPAPLPPELGNATPSLSFQWTPLRWARPHVGRPAAGPGKALRLGPLTIELSVTD